MFGLSAQNVIDGIVIVLSDIMHPLMFAAFFGTIIAKFLIVSTIRRQFWFIKEFEKRLVRHLDRLDKPEGSKISFYVSCKKILERTYYELFEIRGIMMRRKLDYVTSPADRLFGYQMGCAWVVRDTLKEVRHSRHDKGTPQFLEITKTVCSGNPFFGKLFGWIPLGSLNDVANLMPGLFIIAGIFGTFLGIMNALPELSQMDVADPVRTKMVMDTFLLKISFAVGNSIMGIFFSVLLSLLYSAVAPEKTFIKTIDIFERCLHRLWDASDDNSVPVNMGQFDEHRDPIEALAHLAVNRSIAASKKGEVDGPREGEHVAHKPLFPENATLTPGAAVPPDSDENKKAS